MEQTPIRKSLEHQIYKRYARRFLLLKISIKVNNISATEAMTYSYCLKQCEKYGYFTQKRKMKKYSIWNTKRIFSRLLTKGKMML